jgi:hypothetical protein
LGALPTIVTDGKGVVSASCRDCAKPGLSAPGLEASSACPHGYGDDEAVAVAVRDTLTSPIRVRPNGGNARSNTP